LPAVNTEEIEAAFEAACLFAKKRNDGALDGATREALVCLVSHLLDSLISEQTKFAQTAERRATEAEATQARIVGG
jgi:hypothetical protein